MANKFCRLRKYRRKKRTAKSSAKFNYYAALYWRYHWQVYGAHENLWLIEA